MIPAIATIITVYAVARFIQIALVDVGANKDLRDGMKIAVYVVLGIAAAIILSEWQNIQDAGSSIGGLDF
jgi:hypothetical protein